jgi:hypothetical protein
MPWSVVRVQHSDGTPARGVRVVLGFGPGQTSAILTDRHGEARIEHASTGRARVYVNGRETTSFHAPGTATVTL